MYKSIAAVVVTYNRKQLLKECIEALLIQTIEVFDIYVIDNNSTDGTHEMVKKYTDSRIQYKNTGKNLGGAGGFNYGIKEAMKGKYDFLWIMDDDTIPDNNSLEELVYTTNILKGNFGFLSSYVYWKDNSPCNMNIQAIKMNEIWHEINYLSDYGLLRLSKASFVSFFIKTSVIRNVGLPISEFFIWGDDVEYSERISKDYPSYLVSKSKVLHKMNNNNQAIIHLDNIERINRYIFKYRNLMFVARRNKKVKKYLFRVFMDIQAIIRGNCDKKTKRICVIIKGVCKGLRFDPQIEYIE